MTTLINSYQSEEARQLHEEKERLSYYDSKELTNLKFSVILMLIVLLAIHLYVFS
ncbi:hypothetical protein DSAG12_04080 [Promethearchaeum syntrophicum]|uniref:Uncharacterized protein n=1 Tax=Promethearchaeum syntrophicum TaxID=2594042 RepID=A0AC61ZTW4_9ARCH|nr:hypothetical protein [Candidatus Prometheoarchaeum syntrophicum]